MSYLGDGGREVWSRYVVPPFSSAWRWAYGLATMRRRRDATRSDAAAKAGERGRRMASWHRSHER